MEGLCVYTGFLNFKLLKYSKNYKDRWEPLNEINNWFFLKVDESETTYFK